MEDEVKKAKTSNKLSEVKKVKSNPKVNTVKKSNQEENTVKKQKSNSEENAIKKAKKVSTANKTGPSKKTTTNTKTTTSRPKTNTEKEIITNSKKEEAVGKEKIKKNTKPKTDKSKTPGPNGKKVVEEINIEEIAKELTGKSKLPKEEKKRINLKIVPNIIIQLLYTLYIILLNLGFTNIEKAVYITDLKVFALLFLAVAIIIIEKAYEKDDEKLAVYGIEVIILAIFNLIFMYIMYKNINNYKNVIFIAAIFANAYYFAKSAVTLVKLRKAFRKENSDIKHITEK